MKSIKILIKGISILLIFFELSACKKFVEIPPPNTQLVTATVFNNDATATSAVTAIYSQMVQNNRGESFNMAQTTGLLSDELTNYSTNVLLTEYYTNAMAALQGPGPWSKAYNYIYQANAIILGLQNNAGVSPAAKKQLMGEALFIRAFWNFYLTNLYGAIPLVNGTDYAVNTALPRAPQAEVYQQIITDLTSAKNSLSSNYIDATDTTVTTDKVRPTKWAATALLARVYLYKGEYALAAAQASEVISNTSLYSLCPNLNDVFLANSTEAIWQLDIPLPSSTNSTPDGQYFILVSGPKTGNTSNAISPQLLRSFETGDNRLRDWVGSYITTSAPIDTFYFPYKYKSNFAASVTEYVMVLRLAEQYLIRAEAEANGAMGGLSAAVNDLNIIRRRAGLPDYAGVTDLPSLSNAILHERQVELFTEWGHRWLDLIRTGNVNEVMKVLTPKKGGTWSTDNHQLLFPIPKTEIMNDHNLTQNNGY